MTATGPIDLGTCAFGRAIDAHGRPLDGGPPLRGRRVILERDAPRPNERAPIATPLWTGLRVIDGLLTVGRGARVGIFGAPATGKSSLMETIVDNCVADAVVVALVGERGREAERWLARSSERSTTVCATSDRPAFERIRAADVALAHASALRERGLHVVLVVDSLARVAVAAREIAAADGEPVGRGGYPPSVFARLARMLEVAGALPDGSITLFATVLNDGDERDPVSEAARALLDGHLALSSALANAGHYPSIDLLRSASRTMDCVTGREHQRMARLVRHAVAVLERIEDARALGIAAVQRDERAALEIEPKLLAFLRQDRGASPWTQTLTQLERIATELEERVGDRS
ncbi:MAG: EscN/YscN/HrcN family type III secretion system ATPase [Candidatus Eremiobacteraeota bacterium]|nr:EscN/YscN/HrcN family type III secretion system ATPase [Candidatus Eremiobacteraeota bacterium]